MLSHACLIPWNSREEIETLEIEWLGYESPSIAKRKIDKIQPSAIYRRDSTFTTVCCGVEMWNYWCMRRVSTPIIPHFSTTTDRNLKAESHLLVYMAEG